MNDVELLGVCFVVAAIISFPVTGWAGMISVAAGIAAYGWLGT